MFTKLRISFGLEPIQFIQPEAPVIVLKLRGKATGIYGSLHELFDDAVRIILESQRGSVAVDNEAD
jgi:hypothetical protein